MAFYTIRTNLGAAQFPMLSELGGRSIIVPGQDENYDRSVISTSADADKDKGIPQVFYLHNCLPTANGFQSIGYKNLVEAYSPITTNFGTVLPITLANFGRILLSPSGGVNYILDRTVSPTWNINSSFPPGTVPDNVQVTVAEVQGETYIYYANYGCFRYDTTTKLLTPVVLTGLIATDIIAILASNNYLVAFTVKAAAWSSLLDPTDFTPSIATGAGGGNVAEADGKIISAYSISGGFLVYCQNNVVGARVTSNVNFPFTFQQIPGSGGVKNGEAVSWQSSVADQFAWTNAGLQQINTTVSKPILTDFTDFIAMKVLEDFNEATNALSSILLGTPMQVAVTIVDLRFVVLSYGNAPPDYDYCIVYDLMLKRSGKLKIKHRDCFQWNFPNSYGALTYGDLYPFTYADLINTTYADLLLGVDSPNNTKESIAFLQADGTVKVVDFSLDRDDGNGVFLIGKFQFVRNLLLVHLDTDVETVNAVASSFEAFLLPSMNGKDLGASEGMYKVPPRLGSKLRSFKKQRTAVNITIGFKGAFNLTSHIARFTTGGIY